jgi:hypothetical protein
MPHDRSSPPGPAPSRWRHWLLAPATVALIAASDADVVTTARSVNLHLGWEGDVVSVLSSTDLPGQPLRERRRGEPAWALVVLDEAGATVATVPLTFEPAASACLPEDDRPDAPVRRHVTPATEARARFNDHGEGRRLILRPWTTTSAGSATAAAAGPATAATIIPDREIPWTR